MSDMTKSELAVALHESQRRGNELHALLVAAEAKAARLEPFEEVAKAQDREIEALRVNLAAQRPCWLCRLVAKLKRRAP
jgi:hypothetical protein